MHSAYAGDEVSSRAYFDDADGGWWATMVVVSWSLGCVGASLRMDEGRMWTLRFLMEVP